MNLTKHSLILFCGLSASGMGLAAKAEADSFTITPSPPAAITTTTLSLGAGDVGTVEQGGVIDVINGNGIEGTADGVTVNNAGSVTSGDASGISVLGESTVTNSGTATGAVGGIEAFGDGNTITNSGMATGRETGSVGIYAKGKDNTIINSGTAKGRHSGILASDDGNTITNLGTAEGGVYGIFADGTGYSITNSGKIIGETAAVYFYGSDNTLTLLAGSNVQGSLDLAGDGGNSLVIGRRLNTALRFTAVPEVATETNGMPSVAFGGILAVVDPTVYAAEDDMLGDLTRSLADVVDGRLGFVTGHSANNVRVSTSNAEASGSQWATWATGIGNYRSQTADGIYDGFDTTLGGFALGTDGVLSSGTTFGGFVGASRAHVNTNAGNEQIDTATAYAGLYAGYSLPNAFVNLAVTGGYANTDTSRDVLNNMVVGGIEQAKGNPDGVFFAPQATIGTEIKNAHGIVTPSLRIAYTRLTMGSYEETGSAADMSVGSRTVNVVDLRGQVAFAIKPIVTSTGQFDATMRLGADATLTNSDDITATLLGQPITFSTSSQDTTLRGFAGVDLVQSMDNGANLKLSVEVGYDSGHAVTLKGTAGLAWVF
jgi:uncharacterized protein with beta-barrel porin domain